MLILKVSAKCSLTLDFMCLPYNLHPFNTISAQTETKASINFFFIFMVMCRHPPTLLG